MATNGDSGGNINYNSPGRSSMGISGSLQNRKTGREYSEKFYRETSGYLDNSITEVQNLLKYYEQISDITKDLNKTEQGRFKKQQDALKEQLRTLEYVKDTREVDFEESVKLIKESNKLLISGSKEYQRIMEETQEIQSEADKKHLGSLEEAAQKMNNIRDNAEKTNQDLKDTAKVLNNTTSNLGDALSNTLKKAANTTKDIANMLNLQSIANPENAAKDKLTARNSLMKQLGMTSDSQYNQFNKSLVNELQTMNAQMDKMYSSDDLYAYFEKLDKLGITNQKMAEEQMKASVMGTKYLGVSDETQQAIFKFMRTTNDYSMLDKHNKTIAGLLKSQLGVSKEQLDVMSQTVYSDADVLEALGGNSEQYARQAIAAGAAVDSAMGVSGMGDVLTKTLGQIVTAAPQDLGNWAQIFGSDIQAIRQYGQAGEAGKAIELMINNNQLKNIAGMNSDAIAGLMKELNIDAGLININRYFSENGTSSYNEKFATSLANIENMTDDELAKYLEDTTELTWLEKLSNTASLISEELLGYKGTMKLANAAFIMYLGSGIVDLITNFKSLNLMSLLTSKLGDGSSLGKHAADSATLATGSGVGGKALAALGMGTAIIGLTAGTISALGSYFKGKRDEAYNNQYSENMASLSGTSLANNSSMASAMTVSSSTNSMTGLASDSGNTKYGISYFIATKTTKDKDSLNKALTEWMYNAGCFTNTDDVLAWAYLMNQVGSLDAMNQAMGTDFSSSSLYQIVSADDFDNQNAWNHIAGILDAGWYPYTDNNGGRIKNWQQASDIWDMNKYDGYHKAGKYYIPKDNYKALLHKGEMVLNAREAEALREYIGLGAYGGQSDDTPRPKGKIVDTWPWPMSAGYPSYPSGNQHRGLDFAIPVGTKIGAAIDGQIVTAYTGDNYNTYASGRKVFGQYILMRGNNGLYYRYGHLSKVGVSNNQRVKAGQTIGLSGNTGYSTGPHLHFQVQTGTANNTDIYPYNYVTNGLFQTTGSIGNTSTSSQANVAGETANVESSTRRFIPGANTVQNTGGMGGVTNSGASQIVSSVDGGFNKLISYLESISKRQDEQQILLETFSKARASGPDF